MQSEKFWEVGRMDFGPKMIISVLLPLSLRKLWFIQVLMSVRQLVSGEDGRSNGCGGGDVQLGIVGVTLKLKTLGGG